MSFSINTNTASLQAQNYLRASSDFQGKTINRVTSGLRIVQSGDDAAGLAIANGFRSDEAVLTQGVRNANDGLSQLQIADGGLNNISQLIDRARTLATQSASGTFTGDRGVLNSEFKNVIGEIDRQAQAIGLNTNGSFAKSLSVFVGGGKGSSSTDLAGQVANGSVGVDLSTSTVDSKSLGLKGVQAIGTSGTDIGTGSATTAVSNILANTNNTNSELTSGYTTFSFRGPGFGDGNKINVSVNLSGVTDTNTLVTAINSAISSAGLSGSQAATAFKNANITAGVNIDSQGRSQLTFNSSAAAFQVEAGDKTANALLGNFKSGSAPEGADINTTVTGNVASAAGATTFGTTGAGTLDFRFSGASLTTPVDITLSAASSDTVANKVTQLQSLVANNASLKAAGITLTSATPGGQLAFTSTSGEQFHVDVTGDATNKLGFGSFQAGNLGQFDYSQVTASSNYTASAAAGTAAFEFSINGKASSSNLVSVDLTAGDATAAKVTGTVANATDLQINANNQQVNLSVHGTSYQFNLNLGNNSLNSIAQQINAGVGSNVASVDTGNHLVLESTTKGAGGSIQIEGPTGAGTLNNLLGLNSAVGAPVLGTSRSGADLANALNQSFASNATLQAAGLKADYNVTAANKLTITSANGTDFRLNTYQTTTATAAASVGTAASGTSATAGKAVGTTTGTFDTSTNNVLKIKVDGAGSFTTITLGKNANYTAAQVATDLNNQFASSSVGATASLDATGHLVISSNTTGASSSIAFDTAGNGSTANTPLGLVAPTTTAGAAAVATTTINGTNNAFSISVDGGTAQTFTLTSGARSNAQILSDLSTLTGATASFDANNHLTITSNSTGAGSAVTFNATSNSAYATFGLSSSTGQDANVGYGVLGSTFAGSGNVATSLATNPPQVDAGGASQSTALSFTPILYGSDKQTVTITANDSSGTAQSLSIALENGTVNSTRVTSGRSIDEALSTINKSLQQSNNSTLNQIVAVKDNSAGAEQIKFISTLGSFKVSVGSNANVTGLGASAPGTNVQQGTTVTSAVADGGSTADISSQSAASNAVSALSTAVATLGKAQAVVGRGENQLTYATNLAQSQLTNLATAESRIRDADLSSEAANLTKAQVLLQAGVAALAQANSAPQQVLSLLRG